MSPARLESSARSALSTATPYSRSDSTPTALHVRDPRRIRRGGRELGERDALLEVEEVQLQLVGGVAGREAIEDVEEEHGLAAAGAPADEPVRRRVVERHLHITARGTAGLVAADHRGQAVPARSGPQLLGHQVADRELPGLAALLRARTVHRAGEARRRRRIEPDRQRQVPQPGLVLVAPQVGRVLDRGQRFTVRGVAPPAQHEVAAGGGPGVGERGEALAHRLADLGRQPGDHDEMPGPVGDRLAAGGDVAQFGEPLLGGREHPPEREVIGGDRTGDPRVHQRRRGREHLPERDPVDQTDLEVRVGGGDAQQQRLEHPGHARIGRVAVAHQVALAEQTRERRKRGRVVYLCRADADGRRLRFLGPHRRVRGERGEVVAEPTRRSRSRSSTEALSEVAAALLDSRSGQTRSVVHEEPFGPVGGPGGLAQARGNPLQFGPPSQCRLRGVCTGARPAGFERVHPTGVARSARRPERDANMKAPHGNRATLQPRR